LLDLFALAIFSFQGTKRDYSTPKPFY
jgi:hypothetical protein